MWDLIHIPKILFLYWGRNKKLSYLRYLTVKSFTALNPDWEVIVYSPKVTSFEEWWETGEQDKYNPRGEDWFDSLFDLPKVSVRGFDFEKEIGISNDTPEVIKSDILRLCLLHRVGGVWSDFDILYTKPMDVIDIKSNHVRSYVCFNDKYYSIGFLMGAVHNNLYRILYDKAHEILTYKTTSDDYQMVGSKLFKLHVPVLDMNIGNIPQQTVYPVAYNKVYELFHYDRVDLSESIGVHWFGGNEHSYIMDNIITPDNVHWYKDCIMKRLIQEMEINESASLQV